MYTSKVGEVVGAAGTEGSARTANKKVYNGKVSLASIIFCHIQSNRCSCCLILLPLTSTLSNVAYSIGL